MFTISNKHQSANCHCLNANMVNFASQRHCVHPVMLIYWNWTCPTWNSKLEALIWTWTETDMAWKRGTFLFLFFFKGFFFLLRATEYFHKLCSRFSFLFKYWQQIRQKYTSRWKRVYTKFTRNFQCITQFNGNTCKTKVHFVKKLEI